MPLAPLVITGAPVLGKCHWLHPCPRRADHGKTSKRFYALAIKAPTVASPAAKPIITSYDDQNVRVLRLNQVAVCTVNPSDSMTTVDRDKYISPGNALGSPLAAAIAAGSHT